MPVAVPERYDLCVLGCGAGGFSGAMRAAGPQVSSTIMSIALLMDQDMGMRDVLKSVYPHPTMSEAIQECLRLLVDKSIYKSRAFPHQVQIRTWRPDE